MALSQRRDERSRSEGVNQDRLNELGSMGVELSGVVPFRAGNRPKLVFKRPVMDD